MVKYFDKSSIVVRGRIAKRLMEAHKLGISVDEYLLEILSRDLDPKNNAKEYIEAANELLDEAREELEKGNIRQAIEKIWGATALAVKAYAYWRDSKRLTSYGELWSYSKKLIDELGDWVGDSWNAGNVMHICFYEGWCTEKHAELALKRVEKLVRTILSNIKHSTR